MKNILNFFKKEHLKKNALSFWEYEKGIYRYKAKDGYYHLIRNEVDLLKGKNATWCCWLEDNSYLYKTKNTYYHLIVDGIDIFRNLKVVHFYLCSSHVDFWIEDASLQPPIRLPLGIQVIISC